MNTLKSVLLLAGMSGLLLAIGAYFGGQGGATIALGIAIVMNFASYWWSDKIVLSLYKGKEVKYEDAPRALRGRPGACPERRAPDAKGIHHPSGPA